MKISKKLFVTTISVLCCIIFALSATLGIACGGAKKGVPEVRNNGNAIQWKYGDENEWRDLVSLEELKGAAGENGKDGIDGQNGKDGIDGKDGQNGKDGKDGVNGAEGKNGKTVEVRRTDSYIQWRYEGGEWLNLVALADLEGPAGQNGTNGVNGKTPEFRVNESILQWRYEGDGIWLNLYDLSSLKGLDGKDGKDGLNGKDGKNGTNGVNGRDGQDGDTPFIGENGNWWIGTTDTGVKASGTNGAKGDKGDKGEKGDAGEKGADGKDGSSLGWYYGVGSMYSAMLQRGKIALRFNYKLSSGDLISCYQNTVTLKKGHTYSLNISGSIDLSANNNDNKICVVMTDGYDDELCKNLTRISDVGTCEKLKWYQQTFTFNRIYNAKDTEVTLKFYFEQENYNTIIESLHCMLTIIALD